VIRNQGSGIRDQPRVDRIGDPRQTGILECGTKRQPHRPPSLGPLGRNSSGFGLTPSASNYLIGTVRLRPELGALKTRTPVWPLFGACFNKRENPGTLP